MSIAPSHVTAPSAGWYPDPAHKSDLRFWDGHRWTERVAAFAENPEPRYGYAADGTFIRMHRYA